VICYRMERMNWDAPEIQAIIRSALHEDGARSDLTTRILIDPKWRIHAAIVAKQRGIICGLPLAERFLKAMDPSIHFKPLVPDGTRVYVGSLLDTAITSLDISATSLSSPVRISLAENPIGVNRLRLGIDPYRAEKVTRDDGSTFYVQNQFLEDRGRFLYAITRDDSIRVVDVDVGLAMPIECDANILAPADQKATAAFQWARGRGARWPRAPAFAFPFPIPPARTTRRPCRATWPSQSCCPPSPRIATSNPSLANSDSWLHPMARFM